MTFELKSAQGRAVVLDVDPIEFQARMKAAADRAVESVKQRYQEEGIMLTNAEQSLNILSSQAHGHVKKLEIVREGAHEYVDHNTRTIQEALDRQLTKEEASELAAILDGTYQTPYYLALQKKLREIAEID
jgi:leucyl aminopeptidase